MGKILLFLLFIRIVMSAQAEPGIILSEIMFAPQSGNNEFIELYNVSETESIDLSGYKIKYQTSNPDIIKSTGKGTILQPKSFAIIFEGDYDLGSGIYKDLVPSNALVLTIGDNTFGSSGMSNSSGRTLYLLNSIDEVVDTYTYSADNRTGISDEKVILDNDTSQSNWANAVMINGTPGFRNSVSPVKFDLSFESISITPLIPQTGNDVNIKIKIKNNGTEPAENYSVEIFNDLDKDSTGSHSESIYQNSYLVLDSKDSNEIAVKFQPVNEGLYNLILNIIFNNDENLDNNSEYFCFMVYPPANKYNDLVINEIMYAPSKGEPEWIEIFNRSGSTLNLKNWSFSDAGTVIKIIKKDKYLGPDNYLIISKDSSIYNYYSIPCEVIIANLPSLNNSGDAAVIKDSLGTLIDSINYIPSWGGNLNGKSLERVSITGESNDEENWKTAESKFNGTPGKINSVSPKNYDLRIDLIKPLKDYVIIGYPFQINLKVKNIGLNLSSNYIIKIFNDINKDSSAQDNELQKQISGSSLSSYDSSLFNLSLSNIVKGDNYFIVFVETENDDDLENNTLFFSAAGIEINEVRNDIVINEIMYSPLRSEPEWIELYNKSNKAINIKNYSIADDKDTVKVIENLVVLNPGEFFIVSDDSTISNFYNLDSKYQISDFPTLNNNGDKIILFDSLNRVIDSVNYYSSWGGSGGKSLERIDPANSSIDPSNWKSSKDKLNGTPGKINSVTQKDFDIAVTGILFSPVFPKSNDNVNISVKIMNPGKNDAKINLKLFEDTDLDSLPDILISTLNDFYLAAGDSEVIPINYVISNLQTKRGFYISAVFSQDQDNSNNYIYAAIKPGFPESSIVINEIMYYPSGGEPEWIELFNTTNNIIDLNGWTISDVLTTPVISKITGEHFINPKSYIIIARDSLILNYHRTISSEIIITNLPVLNNDADGVVLKDDRNFLIDSVFYNRDWGGKQGISYERILFESASILSSNWGNSKDIELSTPGRINSIKPKNYDLLVSGISFIPRFPVPGDNVFISAKIKNVGTASAEFSADFYFDSNSDGKTNQPLSSQSKITVNAFDSVVIISKSPINKVLNEILTAVKVNYKNDEDTLNNYFEKMLEPGIRQNALIINEVMFSPAADEPEWIELVNISNDTINLRNWMISDLLPQPSKYFISASDLFLNPGEYFVIAHDTSFLNIHKQFDGKIKLLNFGTLGNNEDGIIIYDFRGGIIDSLKYKSSWGGKNGYSLERLSFYNASNDSTNWASSLSENKSTPGMENSLTNIPVYDKNNLVINEIMFDPEVNNSEFIEFLNTSNFSINVGGWKIEDGSGNSYKLSDVNFNIVPNDLFLLAADSLIFNSYDLSGFHNISILNSGTLGLSKDEEIILKDLKGNIIDSIFYSEKWHNKNFVSTKNISLEKINPGLTGNSPLNWSSSVNSSGATPGKINSIFSENRNNTEKISISPNPFSPDNDGFEDFTIINYTLSQNISQVRIKIFDNRGRLLRTLVNNQPSGSKGSIVFDGLEDDGTPFRMGIYIAFLEALNETSGISETLKTVVVVGRKL